MCIIKNETQYEWALNRVEKLLPSVKDDTPLNDPCYIELELLSNLVADYSEEHFALEDLFVDNLVSHMCQIRTKNPPNLIVSKVPFYLKKRDCMIVVTSKEFQENQKKFLNLAEAQRVIIKRKKQFVELMPRGNVITESLSPSNDPYFDDSRNVKAILKAEEQVRNKQIVKLTSELLEEVFGDL